MTPDDIMLHAVHAWQARTVPAYESFSLPCADTMFEGACDPNDGARFTVRMADGRTYGQSVPQDGTDPAVLLRGGFIYGPGGAPLGFYRRVGASNAAAPPNLAPDPLQLKTIATVTAVGISYDVLLAGIEAIDGKPCYHLTLRALGDPDTFPLHDLWVDQQSFEVRALTYDWNFGDGHRGLVHYRFAPVGPQAIWAIVHIDATAAVTRELFATKNESVNDDLHDIAFPTDVPSYEFTAASRGGPTALPSG